MKFTAFAVLASSAAAFAPAASFTRRSSSLYVLEMPKTAKKISKLEQLKVDSNRLIHPLAEVCTVFPRPAVSTTRFFFIVRLNQQHYLPVLCPSFSLSASIMTSQIKSNCNSVLRKNPTAPAMFFNVTPFALSAESTEVMILFFPRLIDKCREFERPRPISQWTT
jgi:hypothetical protein